MVNKTPISWLKQTLTWGTLSHNWPRVLLFASLYTWVYLFVSPFLAARLAPQTWATLPNKSRRNWHVKTVSLIQSTLVCCATFFAIRARSYTESPWYGLTRSYPVPSTLDHRQHAETSSIDKFINSTALPQSNLLFSNLLSTSFTFKASLSRIWAYHETSALVQCMAAGYFIWDLIISIVCFDILGWSSLIHGICAMTISIMGFRPFANYYGMNFILYELSTPFLNIHWFLDKLRYTGSTFQLVNGIILLSTFAACRLVWGIYQTVNFYLDIWNIWRFPLPQFCRDNPQFTQHRTFDMISRNIHVECNVLSTRLASFYIAGTSTLCVLNFFWFTKMLTAITKRFNSPASVKVVKSQ